MYIICSSGPFFLAFTALLLYLVFGSLLKSFKRPHTLAFGNHATLIPLGQRGVRISMQQTPCRTIPGSHILLCFPEIRPFETYPFTVASINPLEPVISARDGSRETCHPMQVQAPALRCERLVMEWSSLPVAMGPVSHSVSRCISCGKQQRRAATRR